LNSRESAAADSDGSSLRPPYRAEVTPPFSNNGLESVSERDSGPPRYDLMRLV